MAQTGPVKTMFQTTHSLLFTAAVMPQASSAQTGSALHRQTKSDDHLVSAETQLKRHKPSLSDDLQLFKDGSAKVGKSNWNDFVSGSGTSDQSGQIKKDLVNQGNTASPEHVSVAAAHLPQYDRVQGQTSILESLSREFGTSFHMQLPVITSQEQLVTDLDKRPPPPEYPGTSVGPEHGLPISNTVRNMAAGGGDADPQPEGSRSAEALEDSVKEELPTSHTKQTSNFEVDHEAIAGRATKMVEILSDENTALRQELDGYYQKVSKLQKFERDVHKVQAAHETIVESTKKREILETKMRMKLELDLKRLQAENKELRVSAECLQNTKLTVLESQYILDSDLKAELAKKDTIITHLIAQHNDEVAAKERLEVELSAQTATLTEQRNHIDLLDTVLSNAQANVSKMQEESRKRQILEEQVESIQKTMFTVKAANLKREKKDQEIRLDLEKQIENLKNKSTDGEAGVNDNPSNQSLMEMLNKKEEKISSLEADISKMELKLQEENAIRMIAQSNTQRDARIAALEKNSLEAERVLVDAQTEKTRQAEDIYLAKKRIAELEAKVRILHAELSHKDSVIQVLQHQSLQKDASLSSLEKLLRSTTSPHSSLQNLRTGSSESVQQSRLSGSSNSLQNLAQKSPVNSMQNLTIKSPGGSYQNLTARPQSKGYGSQERLLMMGDSYMSHSTTALSSVGLQEFDKRYVLDEKLKKLDQDIAQQDKILDSLFKKSSGQNV